MWPGLAIVLKAEASLSQAEWEARAHRAVSRTKKCSTVQRRRSPVTLTQIPAARSPAAPLAPPPAECGALQRFSCSRAAAAAQRLAPRRRRSARATCSKLSREPPGFPSGVRTHQNRCCSRARLCAAAEQSAEPGGCTSGWSSSSRAALLLLLLLSNPCHNHDSRLPCHSPQKRQSATKWVDKRVSCAAPLMENFFSKIAVILSQLDIC